MVKVYSADWCAYCPMAIKFLEIKGVEFEVIKDVPKQSYPTIEFDDGYEVIGYSAPQLADAIKNHVQV